MILSLARTVLLFFCAGEFAFLNLLQPRIPTRQACAHSWPISFGLAPAPPRPGAGPPPGPPGAESEPRAVFGERGRPRPEGHRRGGVGPRGAGGAPLPPMPALRDVSPADGASVDDDDDVVWGLLGLKAHLRHLRIGFGGRPGGGVRPCQMANVPYP